jgi:hypothetical protein
MYSLATAAAACGVSKSVILRAIIAGKISGSKDKHGEWHVEPAPRYAAPPDATALAEAHRRFSLAEQASRLAQQRAVSCILHERMLE